MYVYQGLIAQMHNTSNVLLPSSSCDAVLQSSLVLLQPLEHTLPYISTCDTCTVCVTLLRSCSFSFFALMLSVHSAVGIRLATSSVMRCSFQHCTKKHGADNLWTGLPNWSIFGWSYRRGWWHQVKYHANVYFSNSVCGLCCISTIDFCFFVWLAPNGASNIIEVIRNCDGQPAVPRDEEKYSSRLQIGSQKVTHVIPVGILLFGRSSGLNLCFDHKMLPEL